MGSGLSGSYVGTGGGSQSFAFSYSVVPSMKVKDMADPDIYDPKKGYFKNPTATKLEDAIDGDSIYLQGKKAHGKMTYVMDEDGNIIFGKRKNPNNSKSRSPHPTLLGGKNPKVKCAGMITFNKGKIVSIDNDSGHYRPNLKSMVQVDKTLNKLCKKNPNIFDKNSKWRKNNG